MKPLVVMAATRGLNLRVDPARLAYDPNTASTELSMAVNVAVDDTGRVERFPGFTSVANLTGAHSCFATKAGELLGVTDNGLCKLTPGGTATVMWAGCNVNETMRYVELPEAVYMSNGIDRLMYKNGVVTEWAETAYFGDRQDVQVIIAGDSMSLESYRGGTGIETERVRVVLQRPPAGTQLAAYNGRIYIASGRFVHHTEGIWRCWYAPAQNWRAFDDEVKLLVAVDDGLYVGTTSCIYFLAGTGPSEFALRLVWTSPVVEGAHAVCDALDVGSGDGRQGGKAHLAFARNGLLLLGRSGQVTNLLDGKMQPLTATRGTAAIVDGRLVALFE